VSAASADESRRGPVAAARRIAREARALGPAEAIGLLRDTYARNDLLTYASAISFQLFFALIPLCLFALGLLGGSGLQDVWTSDVAPRLREVASPAAFTVVDETVRRVLETRQTFWVTVGALLALWELSGAVRAVIGVLNRLYGIQEQRSFWRRMAVSLALSGAIIVLLATAAAAMEIAPRVIDGPVAGPATDALRWPVAFTALSAVVILVVRFAPAERRSPGRVTFGSTLVIVAWLVGSAGFAFYLTDIADYGSVFGGLATLVAVLTYLYVATIAFLTGLALDSLIQERA
jgi:membrane protein